MSHHQSTPHQNPLPTDLPLSHTSLKSLYTSLLSHHQSTLIDLLSTIQKSTAKGLILNPKQMMALKQRHSLLLRKLEALQRDMDANVDALIRHQQVSMQVHQEELKLRQLDAETSEMVSLLGRIYHESFNIQRHLQKSRTTERNDLAYDDIVNYAEKIAYVISAPPGFKEGETVLTQYKPPYPRADEWMFSLLYEHKSKEYIQHQKTLLEAKEGTATETAKEAQLAAPTLSGMVDTMQMMTHKRLEMQNERMKMEASTDKAQQEVAKTKPQQQTISLFGLDDDSSDEDSDEG